MQELVAFPEPVLASKLGVQAAAEVSCSEVACLGALMSASESAVSAAGPCIANVLDDLRVRLPWAITEVGERPSGAQADIACAGLLSDLSPVLVEYVHMSDAGFVACANVSSAAGASASGSSSCSGVEESGHGVKDLIAQHYAALFG